jgi:hypothetical protein
MATAETVELGPAHPPKTNTISAFKELFVRQKSDDDDITKTPYLPDMLIHKFNSDEKHSTSYFHTLREHGLTASDLIESIKPAADDEECSHFEEVRVAPTPYGYILFGKIRIPALPEDGPCYLHIRFFEPEPGTQRPAELHSIRSDSPKESGESWEAIFTKDKPLEWFDH